MGCRIVFMSGGHLLVGIEDFTQFTSLSPAHLPRSISHSTHVAPLRRFEKLCVIGLPPMHVALQDKDGVNVVNFTVEKFDRNGINVWKTQHGMPIFS